MAKLAYDAKRCGRCNGTGSYAHYGACYSCRGAGTKLTPSGSKAHALVAAFIETHFTVAAVDLRLGDQFTEHHAVFSPMGGMAMSRRRLIWSVVSVRPDTLNGEGRLLVEASARWRGETVVTSFGFVSTTRVRRVVSGDRWASVVAFARTLKRGVTIVEEAVAEAGATIEVLS